MEKRESLVRAVGSRDRETQQKRRYSPPTISAAGIDKVVRDGGSVPFDGLGTLSRV